MTEQEAINSLNVQRVFVNGSNREAIDKAISALEEIRQYRELGTLKELREAREKQ